jgi:hypothetical protein
LNLAIPPNTAAAEVVSEGDARRKRAPRVHAAAMHLRGKDFEFRVVSPEGAAKTVLKGRFDFEWQMGYELPSPWTFQGIEAAVHHPLRQLEGEPLQPNPETKVLWGPRTGTR